MPNSASLSTYTTMMRVNSKGRPYAKDVFDLYSALLIQLPLTDHRSLFRTYPSTFTTDEAVESLGNLEFTHLVSTPNPLDSSSPLLTRTTTTFSMSRAMAKTLGQHFINARLTENASDPQNRTMKDRGIWSPTPKGKFMIQDFSHRARVPIKHMQAPLSRIQSFPIVQFERLLDDDQISFSRQNMIEAFKTMMEWLPTDNIMIDDIGGVNNENLTEYKNTFYGYQCFEWISEYTSVVSNEESEMIAAEFVQYGWVLQILDKSDKLSARKDDSIIFKYDRRTQYYLTEKGRQTLEANRFLHGSSSNVTTNAAPSPRSRTQSSSNTANTETSSGSSSSSIKTNNSSPPQPPLKPINLNKSKKEEYASRLLPTTAITSLDDSTVVVPKAIITKQKSTVGQTSSVLAQPPASSEEMRVTCSSESMLQIDNNSCDFGFSSASSTTSSAATTVAHSESSVAGQEVEEEEEEEEQEEERQNLQERLDQLRLHDRSDSGTILYASLDHHHQHQPNSQHARLQNILEDPLIRMYFRHFLKSCFCEENINFWVDYTALIKKLDYVSEDKETIKPEELLSLPSKFCDTLLVHCCSIYNNYFCPDNAPSELNIDHGLRYDIVQYMQATFTSTVYSSDEENGNKNAVVADASNVPFGSISVSSHGIISSTAMSSFRKKKKKSNKNRNGIVGMRSNSNNGSIDDSMLLAIRDGVQDSPQTCLYRILLLYDQANNHVCRIMAQDSVPRFMRSQRYKDLMKLYYLSPEEKKKKLNHDNGAVEEEDDEYDS